MEKKIRFLHGMDNIAILVSLAAVWGSIIMILLRVVELSESRWFTILALISAFAVLASLTATAAALFFHLKNNRNDLYTEDLKNSVKSGKAA